MDMRIISTDRQSYFDKFRLSTESLSVFYGSGCSAARCSRAPFFLLLRAYPAIMKRKDIKEGIYNA